MDFSWRTIEDDVLYSGECFEQVLNFEGAEIRGKVEFDRCTFKEFVHFRGALLPQRVHFLNCVFENGASFAAGNGRESDGERMNDELHHLNFEGSVFDGYVTFNNRNILRSANFRRCTFRQPPHFQNSELHSGTKFEGSEFAGPRRSMDNLALSRFAAAYRRLSILMRERGDTRLSTLFHSLEMSARRISSETSLAERIMLTIYWAVSDYGSSISKPFWFLLIVSLLNSIFLWAFGVDFRSAAGFVANQTFSPFSGAVWPDALGTPPVNNPHISYAAVSALQGVGVGTSVSLFFFALRRRFH